MEYLIPRLNASGDLPVFTIAFDRNNPNNSILEFGVINHARANGPLSVAPVDNSSGRWLVENVTFVIGDPGNTPIRAGPGNEIYQQSVLFGPSRIINSAVNNPTY